jgi:hypothetical protein
MCVNKKHVINKKLPKQSFLNVNIDKTINATLTLNNTYRSKPLLLGAVLATYNPYHIDCNILIFQSVRYVKQNIT